MTKLENFFNIFRGIRQEQAPALPGSITKPEAAALAGIETLHVLSLKNFTGSFSEEVDEEIDRRAKLIMSSPVRKSAVRKAMDGR